MSAGLLVVAGLGDVGMRLARRWQQGGGEVVGVRRRAGEDEGRLRQVRADLASGERLQLLPRRADALVFCAAPDQRDEVSYRALYLDGLRRMMDACQAPRLIFASSTAVYGQDQGEWVDESTPAEAASFNGQVLREAERALSDHAAGIALRLSGLYGPGREAMLRKARTGEPPAARWTNRLHVEDAAAALAHLIDLPAPQSLYLGSDDAPALESDVVAWIRAQEGLPALAPATGPATGRRVANTRLRATGWRPEHPDYREGYVPLLRPAAS
ncbi:NAD-dependent epimerase/dehydratase family protein [Arenimonas sp. MALMAid1274]|uniref:NAD-dependent epimerase/dehydratase family protein n=1 Tax=Arenimonas sp. MALMAid1274 TaxID=3411630 RepID=UPI003B9E7AB2